MALSRELHPWCCGDVKRLSWHCGVCLSANWQCCACGSMLVHGCFFVCHFGGTKNIKPKKIYIGNIFWPLERFNFYQDLNFYQKSHFFRKEGGHKGKCCTEKPRVTLFFQDNHFWQKVPFLTQCAIFDQNFRFWPKVQNLLPTIPFLEKGGRGHKGKCCKEKPRVNLFCQDLICSLTARFSL